MKKRTLIYDYLSFGLFLNQARAGHRPAHAWFLKTFLCRHLYACLYVSVYTVCVCLPSRLLITSGVMWRDMESIWLVKQGLQLLYSMAAVVVISGGHGLRIETRCSNQPNKNKLLLYGCYYHFNNGCTQAARRSASVITVVCMNVRVYQGV